MIEDGSMSPPQEGGQSEAIDVSSDAESSLMPNTARVQMMAETENELREQYVPRAVDVAAEWAGILHDHSVSEAYKQAHPEVSFTPEGLMLVGELISALQPGIGVREEYSNYADVTMGLMPHRLSEWLKKADDYASTLGGRPGRDDPDMQVIRSGEMEERGRFGGGVDLAALKKINPELGTLLSNPKTTIEELNEYFIRELEQEDKEKAARKASLEAILEDVRSGQTAEVPADQ